MNFLNNKAKYGIVLMVVIALVLQIAGPILSEYVYADESKEEVEIFVAGSEGYDREGDNKRLETTEIVNTPKSEGSVDEVDTNKTDTGKVDNETKNSIEIDKEDQIKDPVVLIDTEVNPDIRMNSEENIIDGLEASKDDNEEKKEDNNKEKDENEENKNEENKKDPVSWNEVKIDHVDSSGNPIKGPFQIDSHVNIKFSYSIVDGAQVDTNKIYNFIIPEEIKIINELDLEIKDGNRVLGNVKVQTDGTMTVQFLDEINNEAFEDDRTGWVTIKSQFDETKLGDGGDKTIEFEYDGKSKDIIVEFLKKDEKENVVLEKSGNYDTETNEITWTVKVKPTTEPAGRTIKDINIKDIIQTGQTYIPGSAELNGKQINPDPVNGSTLNYTFTELVDGENQTITFKTKADLANFTKQGDKLTFKNTVGGNFGDDKESIKEVENSVTTTVNFIKKTGKQVPGEGKINWKLEVNNNNLDLPAGIVISDTVGEGLKFNKDLRIDGNSISDYGTIVESDGGFTFTFTKAINKKHVLTYSTDVTDDVYQGNTSKYTNKADIEWEGITGGSTSTGDVGVNVTSSVIAKAGAGYDPATHKVTWKITINSNKIGIKDPIVTEILDGKLEYVSHSFDEENDKWIFDKTNMTFKYDGTISETYTLTLVTKIKDEYKGYFGDNKTQNIPNKVTLRGTGVKNSEAKSNQEIKSQVIKKSAEGYDYTTRIAKWKIVVNQNNMKVDNAVLTDDLGEFHTLISGTLKVDGNEFTGYTIEGNKIIIELGTIEQEKTITFETQIPEDKIDEFFEKNGPTKLENKSTFKGDQINGEVKSNTSQSVKNTVVSKKGKYEKGNDFIDWEVVINSNELDLKNVKLTDILQEGLIFDYQSVTLNKLTLQSDGSLEEGSKRDISTSYDSETRIATFYIGDMENAYILRFRTDIEDDYNNKKFTNSIKLSGSNGEETGTSSEIGVRFQTGDAGGSGSSTRGSLIVKKVYKEDPINVIYLEGAKFELYKSDKTTLAATSEITGEDGTVLFDKLKMGKYYIKEIQAPEGYVLDESLKEVTLAKGINTKYITYEFENERIKSNIELSKQDINGRVLAGAEFTIYDRLDEKFENPLETVTSDKEGKVIFENINYGEYIIRETKAPSGYYPLYELIEIIISETDKANITIPGKEDSNVVVNTRIPYTPSYGSVEFLKQDSDGNPLKEAEFGLYYKNDTEFQSPFKISISNEDGKVLFDNIAYGEYNIREIKAPEGYILSDTVLEVVINTTNITIPNPNILVNEKEPEDPEDPEEPTDPENPDPEDPTDPTDPDPEDPEDPEDPTDPENPTYPTDPEDPNKPETPDPTQPTDPSKPDRPTYGDGDLVQTGTDINMLIPLGFIIMLLGAAYIFKDKLIKR